MGNVLIEISGAVVPIKKILEEIARYLRRTANEVERHVLAKKGDAVTTLYHLLVKKKAKGLSITLQVYIYLYVRLS